MGTLPQTDDANSDKVIPKRIPKGVRITSLSDGEYYFDDQILVIKDHKIYGYRLKLSEPILVIRPDPTIMTTLLNPTTFPFYMRVRFALWRLRRRAKKWLTTIR